MSLVRLCLAACLFLGVPAAMAATINVPSGAAPTIQAGIDQASPGDVVLVAPGTYDEALSMIGKAGITLRGSGQFQTIIRAPGVGPAIDMRASTDIEIDSLHLTSVVMAGDDPNQGAIRVRDSSQLRVHSVLFYRHASNGIVMYGSEVEAWNNVFAELGDDPLRAESGGLSPGSRIVAYNNTIANNRGGSSVGTWLHSSADSAILFNNIYYNNDYNLGFEGVPDARHDYNVISTPAVNFYGSAFRNANEPDCDPAFVNPGAVDYHLAPGSCAIDAGTAVFEMILAAGSDFEDDGRPMGAGFEIGADEVGQGGPNQPPTCAPTADPPACRETTLHANASDPDGDALTYLWSSSDCADATFSPSATDPDPLVSVPGACRTCTFDLLVGDGQGGTCTGSVSVAFGEASAPVLAASVLEACLWPPNHGMVDVGLSASASDACSAVVEVTIGGITSDEATGSEIGAGGPGHAPDARVDGQRVWLRAERSGESDGRVYRIEVRATDECGNVGRTFVTVHVPHDQHPRTPGQRRDDDPDGPCPAEDDGDLNDAMTVN